MEIKVNSFKEVIAKLSFIVFSICALIYFGSSSVYAASENVQNVQKVSSDFVLTLQERGNVKEQINGADINFKYDESSKSATFNEALLKQKIDSLKCFDESGIIESKNPKIEYVNGSYVIRKEIYGTRVNKDVLYKNVVNAIMQKASTVDLEKIYAYEDPIYTASSQKVVQARDTLNKYVSSSITYSYGGNSKVLNGSAIKSWIYVDGEYNISLNESKAREFVDAIADEYTYSLGRTIAVSGGADGNNHGWEVDRDTETASLIGAVKSGQSMTKYPAYKETASLSYLSGVSGDTFVEVDMGRQYLWFYKNGYIVAEGNIVTGNLSQDGCATPAGIYSLNNKQRDTSLVGPNYVSPVSFWMPFIGNSIGLHDANWRSEFGGEIYKTSGSHGCVNLPYSLAQSIYENISVGTPVVCHY
ncbi:MAG: L,D-transpeptidase family protein [Clostridium sp.]|nr:L,D-transpeptidase family protein [Clostridium sp.]